MNRWLRVATLFAALLPLGCIVENVTHTLLLEPGGGVSWIVLERNARSTSDKPEERLAEEQEFLAAATSGDIAAARALRLLGADTVAVSVLRDRRPFAVWTEAHFTSAADAVERFVAAHGLPGCARFWSDGTEQHLELRLLVPEEDPDGTDEDDLGLPMPDNVDHLEFLLTEGHFVAGEGFTFDDDRAELIPVTDEEIAARGGTLVLSLSWTTAPEAVD